MTPPSHADQFTKTPNVSGQFYSDNPKELSVDIDQYFKQADIKPFTRPINLIIAPHAGYFYSGPVAAYSFKAVSQNIYKTIIILAPSHYLGFDGISIWPKGAFETPLGSVAVDQEFAAKLIAQNSKFYFEPKAFDKEHSVEVEIPFLQKTFKDFKIVPVIMGQPSFELLKNFATALNKTIGNRKDVLIVVSTDLSHYHNDKTARQMDARSLEAVEELNVESLWAGHQQGTMEMCGVVPVTAAIFYAKEKGLDTVTQLHYGNSGDVTDEKNRVVGYGSMAIYNSHE